MNHGSVPCTQPQDKMSILQKKSRESKEKNGTFYLLFFFQRGFPNKVVTSIALRKSITWRSVLYKASDTPGDFICRSRRI